MTAEILFITLFVRNQSLFEEAREAFEEDGESAGLMHLDRLCEKLDLEGDLEELAESYIRGEYDPLS